MAKLTIEIIASRVHGILSEREAFRNQAPAKMAQIKGLLSELAKVSLGNGLARAHRIQFQSIPNEGSIPGEGAIFKEAPYVEFAPNNQTFKIVATRGVTVVIAPSEEDRSRGSAVRNIVRGTSAHELLEVDAALVQQIVFEHLWDCTKSELCIDESEVVRAELRFADAAAAERGSEVARAAQLEHQRRGLAGIGSPLHEAIRARLSAELVGELELDALERLAARI